MEIIRKIGNVLATLLLGDTRENIVALKKDVEYIRKDLDEEMKPLMKEMNEKVIVLWAERVANSASPMQLNPRGREILHESGVQQLIDGNPDLFIERVKQKQPRNAYWVQKFAKEIMFNIKKDDTLTARLEEGAYTTGVDIDTVLFVGSLYVRDLVLQELNFSADDIDKKKE